jgi:hypothetical protein
MTNGQQDCDAIKEENTPSSGMDLPFHRTHSHQQPSHDIHISDDIDEDVRHGEIAGRDNDSKCEHRVQALGDQTKLRGPSLVLDIFIALTPLLFIGRLCIVYIERWG